MSQPLRSVFKSADVSLTAAVIVARPIEETLWAGGLILGCPNWNWFILALCGGGSADLSPRFWQALDTYDAIGCMSDLDDSPEPEPLDPTEIRRTILAQLPATDLDVIVTHGPLGEYTQSLRSEETSQAVTDLWRSSGLTTKHLLMFAYEDAKRTHLARPRPDAHLRQPLPDPLRTAKHRLATSVYGLEPDSWLARSVQPEEAFYHFDSPQACEQWLAKAT
jgi:hypothetical protein